MQASGKEKHFPAGVLRNERLCMLREKHLHLQPLDNERLSSRRLEAASVKKANVNRALI